MPAGLRPLDARLSKINFPSDTDSTLQLFITCVVRLVTVPQIGGLQARQIERVHDGIGSGAGRGDVVAGGPFPTGKLDLHCERLYRKLVGSPNLLEH